jgi:hypothetical protein
MEATDLKTHTGLYAASQHRWPLLKQRALFNGKNQLENSPHLYAASQHRWPLLEQRALSNGSN